MIDPALIPTDICSRKGIGDLNELLGRLEARKVESITLQEPVTGFRASNYVKTYCQTNIRRCLSLFESSYGLFFTENVLVSLLCVRAIYETVAAFCYFEQKFQTVLVEGDLDAIFAFVKAAAHATRSESLIQEHGDAVKAVNILTQVEKLKSLRPRVWEEYEFLSDITHPNSLGGFHFFANNPDEKDVVTFSDGGQEPRADLQWILVGGHMLTHFEAALIRIETALPGLSEKGREQSPNSAKKPDDAGLA
jgi:hypothetical protein